MTIESLKSNIENKTLTTSPIIIIADKPWFLINQYIVAIASVYGCDIEYIDNIDFLTNNCASIFGDVSSTSSLRVYNCDKLESKIHNLDSQTKLVIVCKSCCEEVLKEYSHNVVAFPKSLEDWMIKDYVYSSLKGVDIKKLDWLISICNNNLDRLYIEVNKLKLFDESQYSIMFDNFVSDGVYNDLSDYSIFSLSNAIQSRDINQVCCILNQIKNIDVEPIGLLKILWQNFKKLVLVWMNNNPTPQTTGLKSNQIYAINKLPRVYSKENLIDILLVLTEIDYKLKEGYIDNSMIIDYLVVKILSV